MAKRNFINNADFTEALRDFRRKLEKNPEVIPSDYIGKCIIALCTNLTRHRRFSGYTHGWKDMMISDGIMDCVRCIRGFDPDRGSAFAYFTRAAWNAFRRRIDEEKTATYVKHKNMQNMHLNGEIDSDISNNDLSNSVIKEFEDYRIVKKDRRAAKREAAAEEKKLTSQADGIV